ncbi:GRB10-interacting GYF protein 2 isoform X1 [Loxodonta africana]|uniref:GRB10-interacting GYF protein 2 isoform X1 n=1 Tax=Loxodonta africana TaxID=9785 RepID=UPI0030D5D875
MAAETQTLNFGPEWLRALSSGGSITSPPLSPALPKYKLADYRYGREEMLALFLKDNKIPSDLLDKEFLPILQEEPLPPLALVPFTEEEQRNFSMSVNSAAVLRLTGRGGGGTVVGAPRGRSSSRGRGRGRGECGFYQRSFDEVEGVFGRGGGREMHRSQSWEERGDRRFEKPGRKDVGRPNFEEGGPTSVGRKHEFIRSESENWRIFREEQNGEDEDGGWRLAGSRRDGERWRPHSPGWREHMERRRRFEFDFRDRDDERGYRRVRSGSGSIDDDRDSLPEWCLEDAEEEMGTFDSSGAFLSLKKVQKEPIPEEQEMDFRPVEEGEECSDSEGSHNEEAKEPDKTNKKEGEKTDRVGVEVSEEAPQTSSSCARPGTPSDHQPQETPQFERKEEPKTEQTEKAEEESRTENSLSTQVPNRGDEMVPDVQQPLSQIPSDTASPLLILPPPVPNPSPTLRPVETPVVGAPGMGSVSTEPDDEEGLKHLEQQAEKMVAYLQDSALDDEKLASKLQEHRAKGVSVPLIHEAMQKWYYKDPQGEVQGPFNNQEMAEWFQAGYFTMSLLVKRACDESFQPLGDIMKMWGRVPFSPGPAPPPHLGELDQERLSRQQELTALYQMQHLQYQQFLIQQQYAQVLAQQQKAALSSQQQQQLALLLQALKMRISDQNIISSVTRSVTVPDNGSIWELQPTASQPTVWEGGSVWDLPLDTTTPGPALEQLQQMEKAKAAKLEQERREAEMRAKREEEERKRQEELRRQQEELLRRQQEEERKRREEEELARRKQEEALRRQREQEIALRRQREEEERQQQEEALRRLEERRREEEERRKQEELLRKQEEEAAKWAREEEEAQRRLEENRLRVEEEAARLRHEEEERKRKELELQRQKELMRQRQQQQQQEALRRLQQQQQQQQLAQMKLPSSSTWGQQSNTAACQSQATLSLAEIQKLEEERERQLREEQQRRQQRELMKALQQQQQQQQQKLSGWGNVSKPAGTTKSLLEIQQEEVRQMQKQQQQQQQQHQQQQPSRARNSAHSNLHTSIGNSVWGSINTGPPNQWASDLVSSIWSNADTKNSNMGFWDDAVKEVGPRNSTNKNKNASLSKSVGVSNRQHKKVEEEEKLLKLFQGVNKVQDGFTQWCEQMLHALNTANNLDVPTFVSFLKEVESPYEVHDYIRAYLGDTSEAKEFAKQFLERRAKQKASQQRQQQQPQPPQVQPQPPPQDPVWGVNHSTLHSVFQTNQSNNQQSNFEAVQSGKKKKKQKMVRADPSLLGFSVNASSERLNMGEIETLDDY